MQMYEVSGKRIYQRLWIVHIAITENETVRSAVLRGSEIVSVFHPYIIIIGDSSDRARRVNAEI